MVDARLDEASTIMDGLIERMGRKDAVDYPVKIELELTQWDGLQQFLGFLKYVKDVAGGGHSFEIGADCDADEGVMLGKQKVGAKAWIDGDGSDKIGRIVVNGQELK